MRGLGWTRRIRFGLRGRVTVAFGLMALVLSTLLSVVTWTLVTRYLDEQRRDSALVEIADNAAALQVRLKQGSTSPRRLLQELPSTDRVAAAVVYKKRWFVVPSRTDRDVSPIVSSIPEDLRVEAAAGHEADEQTTFEDEPVLAVGVPLATPGDAYFELFQTHSLGDAYLELGLTLVAGTLLTALLGVGIGRFASRRALRPLAEVTSAAASIARGDLSARLDADLDPELRELATSFNTTAAALQRRVASDVRFAGDVSHELRTPLTTMLNSMEMLQRRRDGLPADVHDPLDLLGDELARFRRLVVDLLDMAHDVDGADPEREPLIVADLVRRVSDSVAGRRVTEVEESAATAVVRADRRRLEQVVVNVVENAMQHGRGCVQVVVRDGDAEVVKVQVDDAGPGVPYELRERIFERFARGNPAADDGGVGLGLAIASRHVATHGGRLWVEDRPGGGARFVICLPRDRETAYPDDSGVPDAPVSGPSLARRFRL